MITLTNSNVFNTDADAIVNTINCVGFMGKGLAFEYSLRYPDLLDEYKAKCKNNEIMVGKIYYYKTKEKLIVNFPTKNDYKYPSKIEWIKEGLLNFKETYKIYNIKSIALPLLGCSNGGLNYKIIIKLIFEYLSYLNINIYICLDKNNPEGKELEMLNSFKTCDIDLLSEYVKLNSIQKNNLNRLKKNITRFYQISKIDGIGLETYKKIYSLFYNNKYESRKLEQQTLF